MPLTIYILCYNRPDFARLSILSVLAQTCNRFTFIVSDHSTNDAVQKMVSRDFPDITYIRRSPALKHLEHFNACIEEVQTDYYCLFHDDDIMGSDFVKVMLESIFKYSAAAAFACNAYIESHGKIEPRLAFLSRKKYELINTPRDLAKRYFSRNQSGIAPNPSYIYSRRLAGYQRFLVDGGKYADVSLLLDILQRGPIVWVNSPLITYRMHGNNLGSVESFPDRLRFLGYLKKYRVMFGEEILQDYRCSFIYKSILKSFPRPHAKRAKVARSFLNAYHLCLYTRLSSYQALLARALVKWAPHDLW